MKKVFVSGCFDLFHSGHVQFLQTAARYGRLYVSVGSDATVRELKGRLPIYSQRERLRLVRAVRWVAEAFVASGSGVLDFADDLKRVRPDRFVVNADGHAPAKEELCRSLGIEYLVLPRRPGRGMVRRSTTALVAQARVPFRLDLAGGWLDQPWVSRIAPGPVITVSIEPSPEFAGRSGMAGSTRTKAIRLWGMELPEGDPEETARVLFAYDNPPGAEFVSGSQDALGIVLPGANRLYYAGGYWPEQIDTLRDAETLAWLQRRLRLLPLGARPAGYSVLDRVDLRKAWVESLAWAAEACWQAIARHDAVALGEAVTAGFSAQCAMFPRMTNPAIRQEIDRVRRRAHGVKITGAGGGGYLILVTDDDVPGTLPVTIRTEPPAP
ncbi:MAG: adenylyltransferase/cytidyltransferase family protein [Thermoguttaceae bacterium]|jgi:cytidyltransferase-like protein|nr:adenylyltransferase/cytidyltransferase family protein [Thermoguttaceae bacterium]